MEAWLRNKNPRETLSYRFITPIYNLPDDEWNSVCYAILIFLIAISGLKIYNSKKLTTFYKNWGKINLFTNLESIVW